MLLGYGILLLFLVMLLLSVIYVYYYVSLLLTVFGPVEVRMHSSVGFCAVIIRLSSGWLSMMLTAVVRVTHLNL
jgi:hypothetical protein